MPMKTLYEVLTIKFMFRYFWNISNIDPDNILIYLTLMMIRGGGEIFVKYLKY